MKSLMYIGAIIGGVIGGYAPVMFGDTSLISVWSIITSLIGGLAGIWIGYKTQDYFDL